ncbi:MAG: hypothetical protein HC906_01555 [Bacteroidales bacterium]|nr:hypothetical protein [Bacteroidales bacterium]
MSQAEEVCSEIAEADIIAVSVGQHGLQKVIERISEGLKLRFLRNPDKALDIIIAENMRNSDVFLRAV